MTVHNKSCFSQAVSFQFEVQSGALEANLRTVQNFFAQRHWEAGTLVVLPELWATGFAYSHCRQLAAHTSSLLLELQKLAAESGAVIAGSLLELSVEGEDKPWNTLFIVDENGVVGRYRKQHLFGFWNEERFFSAGKCPLPIATTGGIIGPLVCYDLRFPVLARQYAFLGARLLIVAAQWPQSRLEDWRLLLRARALENQTVVVACNSCGRGGDIEFAGHSMVVGPDGTILAEAGTKKEIVACALPFTAVDELRTRFCTVGERPWGRRDADKICYLAGLLGQLSAIRRQGSRVAFTNGCFDILHNGHVSYLEQARLSADLLVVGLNADASVRRLKGESRPVNPEQERARVLAALGCVDFVVIFDEDTPEKLITSILPDVLVKGADWAEDEIVGAVEVKAAGGQVKRVVFEHQCSTTALINKIQQ